MTEQFQARQGDVLIFRTDALPKDGKTVERENGLIILAYGEATGHHHAIEDTDVELFETANAVDRWLRVGSEGATLAHQEHAAVALPPGDYRVVRQREYSPEAIQNVAD